MYPGLVMRRCGNKGLDAGIMTSMTQWAAMSGCRVHGRYLVGALLSHLQAIYCIFCKGIGHV